MNVSVGIYELLGYTVPGSLYLALLAYVAERLQWPGLDRLGQVDDACRAWRDIGGVLARNRARPGRRVRKQASKAWRDPAPLRAVRNSVAET